MSNLVPNVHVWSSSYDASLISSKPGVQVPLRGPTSAMDLAARAGYGRRVTMGEAPAACDSPPIHDAFVQRSGRLPLKQVTRVRFPNASLLICMELVDRADSKPAGFGRGGSTPPISTCRIGANRGALHL
jgi:hypothetical protein